jgi:hypothetical protein
MEISRNYVGPQCNQAHQAEFCEIAHVKHKLTEESKYVWHRLKVQNVLDST